MPFAGCTVNLGDDAGSDGTDSSEEGDPSRRGYAAVEPDYTVGAEENL